MGLPGAGHSFSSACRFMTPDPKEARFSGQGFPRSSLGEAKRFPGAGDRLGGPGNRREDICVTFETSSTGCDARAQNRMQRCELG